MLLKRSNGHAGNVWVRPVVFLLGQDHQAHLVCRNHPQKGEYRHEIFFFLVGMVLMVVCRVKVGRWCSLRSLRASHPFMASEREAKPAPRTRVSFRGISRDSDELAVRL